MSAGCVLLCAAAAAAAPKPHIVYILVDDLGHANVGFNRRPPWMGPDGPSVEVVTPAIDALAGEGAVLDRLYVHFTCTPTRSSLLSGRLPVHVQTTLQNPDSPTAGIPRNMTVIATRLAEAGYFTAFVGKWDAGMATPDHTPKGRGFASGLGYFSHKNDFWTYESLQNGCKNQAIVDLWASNQTHEGPAVAQAATGLYEEYLFADELWRVVGAHARRRARAPAGAAPPLFLYYAPHVAHYPLQVPRAAFDAAAVVPGVGDEAACAGATGSVWPGFDAAKDGYACRRQYGAFVTLLDGVVGNLTARLKAAALWADTLLVLSSDNGGQTKWTNSGGSNWPLRGGKYGPTEGGIRVAGLVSGGFLPAAVRGTRIGGMIHGCDWYTTFCGLAGVDAADRRAAAAQPALPPVDGFDVWPLVSGANATSPRAELHVSSSALISGAWKLLTGKVSPAGWSGPVFPNASTSAAVNAALSCGTGGCLFDVVADPTEQNDVAAANPNVTARLRARLAELNAGNRVNADVGVDDCPAGISEHCACWKAANTYGGFFGPFQL